jgi:hypothetical protein
MSFRRSGVVALGTICLVTIGSANLGLAHPRPLSAEIVVGVPLPPPIIFRAPPALVIVPGTYVYVAADVEGDILFHHGVWWWLYDGRWYQSYSYAGPWQYVAYEMVPRIIFDFRPGFRYSYRNYPRLRHEEVLGNWQRWERDRHWEHERREGRHHNW